MDQSLEKILEKEVEDDIAKKEKEIALEEIIQDSGVNKLPKTNKKKKKKTKGKFTEQDMKLWSIISEFFEELKEHCDLQNVRDYYILIDATKITNKAGILLHNKIITNYCELNSKGISEQEIKNFKHTVLKFGETNLNMRDVVKKLNKQDVKIFWKYMHTILMMTTRDKELKDMLKNIMSDTESKNTDNNEANMIHGLMGDLKKSVRDDINSPEEALSAIMKGGFMSNILSTVKNGTDNGSINPEKLLGTVQGLIGSLSSEMGE